MWAGFLRVKCVGAIRPIEQGLGGEKGRVEWRGAGGRGGGVRGVWVSKKNWGSEEKIYAEASRVGLRSNASQREACRVK